MTRPVLTNNAFGLLASDIGPEATTLALSLGDGDRFPNITVGEQHFYVTLIDSQNNIEIVKVTERSGDILTVLRGQDNTTPKEFKATNRVELRFVSALFSEIFTAVGIGFDDSVIRTPVTWEDAQVEWGTVPVFWFNPFFDISIGNTEGAINSVYLFADSIQDDLQDTTNIILNFIETYNSFIANDYNPLVNDFNSFITNDYNPLVNDFNSLTSSVSVITSFLDSTILADDTVAAGSTSNNRVVLASAHAISEGTYSASIASQGEDENNLYGALADLSAVIASDKSSVTSDSVCSIIAASTECATSKARNAIIASDNSTVVEETSIVAASTNCVTLEAKNAIIASDNSTVVEKISAIIAAKDCTAVKIFGGVMYSDNSESQGEVAAVICSGNTIGVGDYTITMGSGTPGGDGEPLSSNRKVLISGEFGDILLAGGVNTGETFADFVEYLPNTVGVEIPPGTLLALEQNGVRPAEPSDRIVGAVSHTGAINTGDTPFCWQGRYLNDEWGRPVYEEIVDERGNIKRVRKQNPDWNPDLPQTPRSERPDEWTPVGILGQVLVRTGESVSSGDSLYAQAGLGYAATEATGVRVLKVTKEYDGQYGIAKCLLCTRV